MDNIRSYWVPKHGLASDLEKAVPPLYGHVQVGEHYTHCYSWAKQIINAEEKPAKIARYTVENVSYGITLYIHEYFNTPWLSLTTANIKMQNLWKWTIRYYALVKCRHCGQAWLVTWPGPVVHTQLLEVNCTKSMMWPSESKAKLNSCTMHPPLPPPPLTHTSVLLAQRGVRQVSSLSLRNLFQSLKVY